MHAARESDLPAGRAARQPSRGSARHPKFLYCTLYLRAIDRRETLEQETRRYPVVGSNGWRRKRRVLEILPGNYEVRSEKGWTTPAESVEFDTDLATWRVRELELKNGWWLPPQGVAHRFRLRPHSDWPFGRRWKYRRDQQLELDRHERQLDEDVDEVMSFMVEEGSSQAWKYFGFEGAVSRPEFNSAYRRKALQLHPDRGGDAAQFQIMERHAERCLKTFLKEAQ